jgi:predicted nucleic acid-binding protein
VIVVDASVLAPALADDAADGERARARLRHERLTAPDLIDLEVLSVLRRRSRSGHVDENRASAAIRDLEELPLRRVPHRQLLARCWEMRHNLTPDDASYAALAELLDVVLVTSDARIAAAPGIRCAVEVLGGGPAPL